MQLEEILDSGLKELGIVPDADALRRFRVYYEYLTEINAVMNLTAIQGEADTARLHFLDCASILTIEELRGKRVIDVGTGAGFPGMVLKILQPDMELTLLDSLDKRIRFLSDTCDRLGFSDVSCIHARAEEAPAELRGSFDLAFSRAVARLNLLCELCLPLVKKNGAFLAMKSIDHAEELEEAKRAIRLLGGRLERVENITIPGSEVTHSLIVIRKVVATPAQYPRRWAQIKKQPL